MTRPPRPRAWTEDDDPEGPPPLEGDSAPMPARGELTPSQQSIDGTVNRVTEATHLPCQPSQVSDHTEESGFEPRLLWGLEPTVGAYNCWRAVCLEAGDRGLHTVVWRGPEEPAAWAAQRASNAMTLWAMGQVGLPVGEWPQSGDPPRAPPAPPTDPGRPSSPASDPGLAPDTVDPGALDPGALDPSELPLEERPTPPIPPPTPQTSPPGPGFVAPVRAPSS